MTTLCYVSDILPTYTSRFGVHAFPPLGDHPRLVLLLHEATSDPVVLEEVRRWYPGTRFVLCSQETLPELIPDSVTHVIWWQCAFPNICQDRLPPTLAQEIVWRDDDESLSTIGTRLHSGSTQGGEFRCLAELIPSPKAGPSLPDGRFRVFLYVDDDSIAHLDKVFLALEQMEEVCVIVYYPHVCPVTLTTRLTEDQFAADGKHVELEFQGRKVRLEVDQKTVDLRNDLTAQFSLIRAGHNPVFVEHLCNSFSFSDTKLITTPMESDEELFGWIAVSDVFIPVSPHFTLLSLIAQREGTRCLFLEDNPMNQEYCLYGEIVTAGHTDRFYNVTRGKIEKVVRVKDLQEALGSREAHRREVARIVFSA